MELRAFLLGFSMVQSCPFKKPEGDFNMPLHFDTSLVLEVGKFCESPDFWLWEERQTESHASLPGSLGGERKGGALCRSVQGSSNGEAPAWALPTAVCQKQPESHLFPVTLNKMTATPVGPIWGQNQIAVLCSPTTPLLGEISCIYGGTTGHVNKAPASLPV